MKSLKKSSQKLKKLNNETGASLTAKSIGNSYKMLPHLVSLSCEGVPLSKLEMGPDLTLAYFWPTVNKRRTRLWPRVNGWPDPSYKFFLTLTHHHSNPECLQAVPHTLSVITKMLKEIIPPEAKRRKKMRNFEWGSGVTSPHSPPTPAKLEVWISAHTIPTRMAPKLPFRLLIFCLEAEIFKLIVIW